MAVNHLKIQRSISACIDNGKRLLEEAQWGLHGPSTGVALAIIAQEECAKAFVLALVRDGIMPWTDQVRRSLSVHECKQLVTLIMEWLLAVNEGRISEDLHAEAYAQSVTRPQAVSLPPDVATAINIYRHEQIERLGGEFAERRGEWRGHARKLANGQRDRRKQAALYVRIGRDGSLSSEPSESGEALDQELTRAKALVEFAKAADGRFVFAKQECEQFTSIFAAMFRDHGPSGVPAAPIEKFDIGIPGVVGVCRTITIADVATVEDMDSPSTT